jgi:hypothetical protein
MPTPMLGSRELITPNPKLQLLNQIMMRAGWTSLNRAGSLGRQ